MEQGTNSLSQNLTVFPALSERVAVPSGTAGFAIYPQTFPRCQGPHLRGRLPPLRGKMSPKVIKGGVWHRAKRDDWGVSHGVNPLRHRCAMPGGLPSLPIRLALRFTRKLSRDAKGPSQRGLSAQQTGEFSPQSVRFSVFPPLKVKNPAEKRFRWFKNRFGCAILGVKVPVWTGNRRA